VVIPTGIQLFAFVATLMVGRVKMSLPMLWIAGALAIFTAGGLTGVMVAIAPFDWQVHDSYFIVAHLHYTLFGGMVFPIIAGIYYFYPFITKKKMSKRLGKWAFWLVFTGFNVTFLPMHLTGLKGMPRRVYTYPGDVGWDWLNMISTIGAFIVAAGFVVFTWDLLRPKGNQPKAARNPWNAGTLEWSHDLVDKGWGSRSIPYIDTRYPLWEQDKLVERMDAGRYYLPDAAEGYRETLITSVIDARPLQVLRVTGPAWITLAAAGFTGGAFIFPTFHIYWPAIVCGFLAVLCILYWLWTSTAMIPEKEVKDVGLDLKLPIYISGPGAAGWWGMFITMLGDATAFASLVFGVFFYWTASPHFPPMGAVHALWPISLGGGVLLVLSWLAMTAARRLNANDRTKAARAALIAAPILAASGAGAMVLALWLPGLDPTSHVYPAMMWGLTVWTVAHVSAGIIMQLYCLAGTIFGKVTPRYDAPLWNVELFWHFLIITVVVTVAMTAVMPRLL
ncbi:hypothetical protein LCGC14_2381320, partial [marine sediment metagenome]